MREPPRTFRWVPIGISSLLLATTCNDDAPTLGDRRCDVPPCQVVAEGSAGVNEARHTTDDPPAHATDEPGDASRCPTQLEGWATVDAEGVQGTRGGGDGVVVRPTSPGQLVEYAKDDQPRVIELLGSFDVPRLQVNSNKTLVGVGPDARINGGVRVRGRAGDIVRNVILRNLSINGATTNVDGDAVQLYFAHHVWIDHCDIYDGPDGNLDMTHGVNWVTVSWTIFRYTSNYQRPAGESSDHRFSNLLGHSDDNAAEDEGRLKVTFHHNWWSTGVVERMPRVRYGQVHLYNNLFDSKEASHCVRAGRRASVLSELNYFDGVNDAHQFNDSADRKTSHITTLGNIYSATSGDDDPPEGGGTRFSEALSYGAPSMEGAMSVPDNVRSCAGPR